MFSGFSTTGANDGTDEEADPTGNNRVVEGICPAVEQWIVGTGVLSARRDQCELVPAMAIDAEGFAD
jgi:hypothetical protein